MEEMTVFINTIVEVFCEINAFGCAKCSERLGVGDKISVLDLRSSRDLVLISGYLVVRNNSTFVA